MIIGKEQNVFRFMFEFDGDENYSVDVISDNVNQAFVEIIKTISIEGIHIDAAPIGTSAKPFFSVQVWKMKNRP